jgi:hypothetical protein
MSEINYYYVPCQGFDKAANSAGVLSPYTGAGNGLTDVQGSRWAVASGLLVGTCDTTDGSQFKRDHLTFPSTATPAGLSQTVVVDIDPASPATLYVVLRRAGLTTAYFIGTFNAASGGGSTILAYNSGSLVASASGAASGFVVGHTLRLTASVSGASPTTVTCTVVDISTGQTISTATLTDSTTALQAASAGALAVTNNAGAASAQAVKVQQFWCYDQSTAPKPSFAACGIDSLTYGQEVSDSASKGGTTVGANPVAAALSSLGSGWGAVNLGNQGEEVSQAQAVVAAQLANLSDSRRTAQWYLFLGGTNDLGHGVAVATIESRIQSFCQSVRAAGWRVAVSTIPPVGAGCTIYLPTTSAATFNSRAATVNAWLRANWSTFADLLVDTAADPRLQSYNATYYISDQLHFSDSGSSAYGGDGAQGLTASYDYPTPAYVPRRLRRGSVALAAVNAGWTDTGILTQPGDAGLAVKVTGQVNFGLDIALGKPSWAYPEGPYAAGSGNPPSGGFPQTSLYDPSRIFRLPLPGGAAPICKNIPQFAVGLAFMPDGQGPPALDGTFDAALYPARGHWFGPEAIPSYPARLYAIFNDYVGFFGDNEHAFTLYLAIGGNPSEE